MDKQITINNYVIKHNNVKKKINIKVISDLHLCLSFNNKKLQIIKDDLYLSKPDYLFVCGDIIDNTNFLYDNEELKDEYINWFKSIAKIIPIYIVLGNHDVTYIDNDKPIFDDKNDFFNILSNIPNIFVSCRNNYYETRDFSILMIELDFSYYYSYGYNEKRLISKLNKYQKYLDINSDKLKILLIHSPANITNKKILSLTKNYDIIISGHMHGGILPLKLNKLIRGNRGLISPNKKLFPKYARGIIKSNVNNKTQYLIISGGITKLQECTGFFSKFNFLFPMEIENIDITNK